MTSEKRGNKDIDMDLILNHPNPIVRLFEYSRRKNILKMLDPKNKVIVDVGCERSPIVKEIIDKCKMVYCVDNNPEFIKESKQRLRLNIKKAVFVLSDANKRLKLDEGIADITICSDVLEHLNNPERCVEELKRVTKNGGNIIISVPDERILNLVKRIVQKAGLWFCFKGISKKQGYGHVQCFNKRSIVELVESYGLVVENVFHGFPFFMNIFLKVGKI